MSEFDTALRIALVCAAVAVFIWGLVALVIRARHGGKAFHAAGAALLLFGWTTLRDPSNNTVAEAREGRIRKGESSGDPLDQEPR